MGRLLLVLEGSFKGRGLSRIEMGLVLIAAI